MSAGDDQCTKQTGAENTTQCHVIETERVVVYIQREIFQAFICFNFDKYG